MIYKTLPHPNTHLDLFYKYKQDNEYLGISVFDKTEFNYSSYSYLFSSIKEYFAKGIKVTNLEELYQDRKKWRLYIENYSKLVWLSGEYINNDCKFKNLFGALFNPAYNWWDIHPGGTRQVVYDLFGPETIEAVAFNTGGIERNYKQIFHTKEELKNYAGPFLYFVLTAEFGSLIPHVHFDQGQLEHSILQWAPKVQTFWKNTNVIGDIPKFITKNNSSNKSKTLQIKLNDPQDEKNIIKSLALVPLYNNYCNHGVEITDVT